MSYASEIQADSPAAWYRMDEASGLPQDSSGNGNHATARFGLGTESYQEPGALISDPASTAIEHDGEVRWSVPDHTTLDLGDVFTLEAWLRPNTDGVTRVVFSKKNGAYEMRLTSANKIRLIWADTADFEESTATITNDGSFHHVVITKNGAAPIYYIDGVDVTPGGISNFTLGDNTDALEIGSHGAGFWTGWLDEIALYPTALSAARVQAHYAAAFVTVRNYLRMAGPTQLAGSAATLYTAPAGKRTRILHIHASNPSASPVDLNLSIGADATATRVYDDYEIAPDSVEHNYDPYDLAAGEIIQGWASTAGTVVLTITGYEDPA